MTHVQSRLQLVAPETARLLSKLEHPDEVALMACKVALQSSPGLPRVVEEAMAAFAVQDRVGVEALRAGLAAQVDALDEVYFRAYSAAEEQNTPEVLAAFSRARAANAVLAALDADAAFGAAEAVYEAYSSLPAAESDSFLRRVRQVVEEAVNERRRRTRG